MGPLLLIITTFIWGTAFLAQKLGADSFGPFALTCFRNILAGFFLVGCILVRNRCRHCHCENFWQSVKAGVFCGAPLCAAMAAQQIGIEYTTPGISAFLTTNYVLFVPVMAALLTRKLPRWHICAGVAMALTGTYFICISGDQMGIGRGEAWTVLCALLFSVQMIVVDHYAPKCDVLVLSAVQIFTAAALALPLIFLPAELARLSKFTFSFATLWPVFYCGVMSSGVAYTLQNFGQAKTPAALAAILLSLESVFGALSGFIFLGDRMTTQQFLGCALVFAAAMVTQLIDHLLTKERSE